MEQLVSWWCCVSLLLIFLQEGHTGRDCDFGVFKLWASNLRENPITAPPLLFDVDGDGYSDVLVPSFSGEVWGVHGENGHIVDNWPFYLEDRSFHSGALVYDVNHDGVLEFLLTTTDAEVVFVQTDNTLLHGETIKIPPLRVKRHWHQEDSTHVKKMANEAMEEQVMSDHVTDHVTPRSRKPANFTTPFSEFDSRFGRHADPLFSRHETTPRPAGIDPRDQGYVYVDPHVLATPVLVDTDGDGIYSELVVAVSYYFDPYRYGDVQQLEKLGGLEAKELVDYTAGGVVIIDLDTGKVKGQTLLGIARGVDSQPGYLLGTPSVVQFAPEENPVIIVGSVMGELHVLDAVTLQERRGFPVSVDSVTSQVAVADVFRNGELDLVFGDQSGIVYCIDSSGRRVWEREVDNPVGSSVKLADVEGDGLVEVLLATRDGDVWVLNGQTGQDHASSRYPIHLNSGVESSVLVMHLTTRTGTEGRTTLGIIVPTSNTLYVVDAASGCVDAIQAPDHVLYEVVSGDIDPYHPGLELLAIGLDGTLVCFGVSAPSTAMAIEQEQSSSDLLGQTILSHKSNSFYFLLLFPNASQEITGTTFNLLLELHSNNFQTDNEFELVISIGSKHLLKQEMIQVKQRETEISLTVPTPPTPIHAFMLVQLCNKHMQCRTHAINLRFNLHAQGHLGWFLCLPFLSLCATLLWQHRNFAQHSLPTTAASTSTRKDL